MVGLCRRLRISRSGRKGFGRRAEDLSLLLDLAMLFLILISRFNAVPKRPRSVVLSRS